MQLFNREYCRSKICIPLVHDLVELDLEIHAILLLHVDYEVYAGYEHEGEEDTEYDVEVKI